MKTNIITTYYDNFNFLKFKSLQIKLNQVLNHRKMNRIKKSKRDFYK